MLNISSGSSTSSSSAAVLRKVSGYRVGGFQIGRFPGSKYWLEGGRFGAALLQSPVLSVQFSKPVVALSCEVPAVFDIARIFFRDGDDTTASEGEAWIGDHPELSIDSLGRVLSDDQDTGYRIGRLILRDQKRQLGSFDAAAYKIEFSQIILLELADLFEPFRQDEALIQDVEQASFKEPEWSADYRKWVSSDSAFGWQLLESFEQWRLEVANDPLEGRFVNPVPFHPSGSFGFYSVGFREGSGIRVFKEPSRKVPIPTDVPYVTHGGVALDRKTSVALQGNVAGFMATGFRKSVSNADYFANESLHLSRSTGVLTVAGDTGIQQLRLAGLIYLGDPFSLYGLDGYFVPMEQTVSAVQVLHYDKLPFLKYGEDQQVQTAVALSPLS